MSAVTAVALVSFAELVDFVVVGGLGSSPASVKCCLL
jgi:hypothetical protein